MNKLYPSDVEALRQQVAELTDEVGITHLILAAVEKERDEYKLKAVIADMPLSQVEDDLRQQVAELEEVRKSDIAKFNTLKDELKAIGEALDDPRTDLSMTMVEVIQDMKKQLAACEKERDDLLATLKHLYREERK
jgi:uncharacterized coiled-coil DUF342 family protein